MEKQEKSGQVQLRLEKIACIKQVEMENLNIWAIYMLHFIEKHRQIYKIDFPIQIFVPWFGK
jgi:hypothetical protein